MAADNLIPWLTVKYKTQASLVLQQTVSRFTDTVEVEGGYVGKNGVVISHMFPLEADEVNVRRQTIVPKDPLTDRTIVHPRIFALPQMIDQADQLETALDLKSPQMRTMDAAMNRKKDLVIRDAWFGTRYSGETGATQNTFPASQVIAVDEAASAATGLTVPKFIKLNELAITNEIDLDTDPLTMIIGPKQYTSLFKEVEFTSKEYRDTAVYENGRLTAFMGIRLKTSNLLQTDSNNYRMLPCYPKSGMHLAIWQDMTTDIRQRGDLDLLPWQLYGWFMVNATRTEDKRVFKVLCSEA